MRTLRKVIKWTFIVLACAFVIAQLWRPARTNPAIDPLQASETHLQVTPEVAAILDRSCNDCHSNKTRWPWYTNVTPVSWFVVDHVDDGRRHMNFSEWGKLQPHQREKMLQELCEEVEDGYMPLPTYTPLHPGSKLSPADVKALCDWASSERVRLCSGSLGCPEK